MKYLLCRNKVKDYDRWYAVFSSHKDAHKAAGMTLVSLFRSADDPRQVFCTFRVEDSQKAQDFLDSPASAAAGEEAGVEDGEYYFADSAGTY
jgi:hypothetical protein